MYFSSTFRQQLSKTTTTKYKAFLSAREKAEDPKNSAERSQTGMKWAGFWAGKNQSPLNEQRSFWTVEHRSHHQDSFCAHGGEKQRACASIFKVSIAATFWELFIYSWPTPCEQQNGATPGHLFAQSTRTWVPVFSKFHTRKM